MQGTAVLELGMQKFVQALLEGQPGCVDGTSSR